MCLSLLWRTVRKVVLTSVSKGGDLGGDHRQKPLGGDIIWDVLTGPAGMDLDVPQGELRDGSELTIVINDEDEPKGAYGRGITDV